MTTIRDKLGEIICSQLGYYLDDQRVPTWQDIKMKPYYSNIYQGVDECITKIIEVTHQGND